MTVPEELDPQRLPAHVAIVMDGNGRWARKRKKPRIYGHKIGADSVRDIVETCGEIGISCLTLYAFSAENWKRPHQEVSGLMNILKSYLVSELDRMEKNQIRLRCLGEISRLPDSVRDVLHTSIQRTAANTKLTLNLALSYGARDEICRAVRLIAGQCRAGTLDPDQVDHQVIADNLYTAGLPDPDLLIRTGGECRLSNFLLWQASYSEIYFTETMWPDFRRAAFIEAIRDYQQRERRFGRTTEQLRRQDS
ncbi:isoprenyl transferase [Desulfofustis glycolicus]|uniref:Isoprenyl transferase n=1 Tax=Desulfofustis glycolicus DSM 9705 TaxID=1121409 RepID=A0A1M5Y5C9_9BACT|nr:isoprenyl transferase [Desulfofustis glycolicus]MCB2215024.1 isoprenyl transferase [Desulfobulbaceae bacterium]SHI07202.1 Undecaprenyl pyrophosphate synthetase [Desulfofustis glycolicus DSM 9705]